MFAKERHEKILAALRVRRALTAAEIKKMFGISAETVRRDLAELERTGDVRRVHGGIMLPESMQKPSPLSDRLNEFVENKRALSRLALSHLREGDTVFVDSGSTAVVLAEELAARGLSLTVLTHSPDIFRILESTACHLMMIGGRYLPEERAFYGALTLQTVEQIHVDTALIFPSAVSLSGVGVYSDELLSVQRAVIRHADRVMVLADSSKFDRTALLRLEVPSSALLVTDGELPADRAAAYTDAGFHLVRAE